MGRERQYTITHNYNPQNKEQIKENEEGVTAITCSIYDKINTTHPQRKERQTKRSSNHQEMIYAVIKNHIPVMKRAPFSLINLQLAMILSLYLFINSFPYISTIIVMDKSIDISRYHYVSILMISCGHVSSKQVIILGYVTSG